MPGEIGLDKSDVVVRILRSDRKTMVGEVLPDSSIEVRAPLSMTTERIQKWLDKYEPKFMPLVTQYRKMNAVLAEHPFDYGGEVLFLGEWIPIKRVDDNTNCYTALYKDDTVVMKPGLSGADMRWHIRDLFYDLAKPIFEKKLHYYSDLLGVRCKTWTIGDARQRHGSCDSNGKITFSWRIVMMSEAVIDYIIVHEVAHLKQLNHSKAFHDVVAEVLPDWKERKKARNEYSQLLHCGGWM